MNVELIGRIRPTFRTEGGDNLIVEGQRIASQSNGPFLNFSQLYRKDSQNYDLFKHSVENLLDLYLAGFNVCLLLMGESDSGKTFTIAGESREKTGMVPLIYDFLFNRLAEEKFMFDTKVRRKNPVVSMQMYEVYNELVKDLLQRSPTGRSGAYLDITENAEKGVYVQGGKEVIIRDVGDGTAVFREGLARRTETLTDYGPASNNAATIVNIDLSMIVGDNPNPNQSRFTVVELPGLEKLSDDPEELRQREGPISKALIALNTTVTSLAQNPFPDRVINYSDSKLTTLLKEELGGNFKTQAILCLKPSVQPRVLSSILTFATRVGQVKNFPILNDSYALNLITQFRARLLDLQHQGGIGPAPMSKISNLNDIKETIRQLETENLQLKDENERLRNRLDSVQSKFGNLASTKTDLSQQLLLTEEEKLKVSQSLVELQIENNKLREEHEASKFELTNKILMLENSLMEAENDRERQIKAARHAKDRLMDMEKDRKDLADEYVVLKTNYLALVREHEKENKKNEELSIELLNLVNAKAVLMKKVIAMSDGNTDVGDPSAEVSRVKALVIRNSSGKVKADEILGTSTERASVADSLFANKKRYEQDIERVKKENVEERNKLEQKISSLQKDVHENRNLARNRQRKLAELNAALIIARAEKEELELQRNRLQHKCKDLGEDYRSRLIKYVEDIAEYVDRGSGIPDGKSSTRLREYMDQMMKDITRSHKEREEQLSRAAQQYRENRRKLLHRYEEVLIHYRMLRLLCEQRGFEEEDLGPDEQDLHMSDSEIASSHMREIARLKNELNTYKQQSGYVGKVRFDSDDEVGSKFRQGPVSKNVENWATLRKQLREYTLNTQRQLEEERARLMSENEVLRQELRESEDYINNHLARYKQEISKLRKMLGYDDDGELLTVRVGAASDRGPRRSKRK